MPSAIVIRAFGPPTMIKLYQPPRDIPTILHALGTEIAGEHGAFAQ